MSSTIIVAAEKIIDGQGNMSSVNRLQQQIQAQGVSVQTLVIDPLSAGWDTPLMDNHFRSGCGPIDALKQAKGLIGEGLSDAVLISGDEPLKTGYSKEQRLQLMAVYGAGYPLTMAYDELAGRFIDKQKMSQELFIQCRDDLFENYLCTYALDPANNRALPDARWYDLLTPRFRGVDCANPLIDFQGRVLLVSDKLANELAVPNAQQVELAGVEVQRTQGDGEQYLDDISDFNHLKQAYEGCCQQAKIDFVSLFKDRKALLEVYSCYPVVPMAFMLASGLINSLKELPELLKQYPVTVTGGMNLARAPWNNPALNGLISLYQQLPRRKLRVALLHGNGGLGYRQGVALLKYKAP
ncbi:MAG: hypothetical protein V7739_17360 [Motiliproteus sp.]